MLKPSLLFIVLQLFIYVAGAKDFSCLKATNQAGCINQYILEHKNDAEIVIPHGKYFLTSSIYLPNNIILNGNASEFKFQLINNTAPGFMIESATNVTVKNITLNGGGVFSANEKIMSSKAYCGFSNSNIGLLIVSSKHIIVRQVRLTGFGHGIIVAGSNKQGFADDITLFNNNIENVGMAGIRVVNVTRSKITNNVIKNVLGNQTLCTDNWQNNAKFADGIYLESIESLSIVQNKISNVRRIGIVVDNSNDKNNATVNHDLVISDNIISNVNSCRGSENNAGIWIEPLRISRANNIQINAIISENKITNIGALSCSNFQYGILAGADNSKIFGNQIMGFTNNGKKNIGIRCAYGYCQISGNSIMNTNVAMLFSDNEKSITYTLKNNVIQAKLVDVVHMK